MPWHLPWLLAFSAPVGVGMWVGVHAAFVAVAAATVVVAWRLNERVRRTATATEEALRSSERRLLEEQETLRLVAGVTRAIATNEDARSSICAATVELAGCSFATLWEDDGEDHLVLTAGVGVELALGETLTVGREQSGAGIAFLSGQRFFVADAFGYPAVSQRMVELTGARSLLFEPVRRGSKVVAVLALGWARAVDALSSRATSVISLLADETAMAVERSDMLAQLADLARTDPLTGLANRRVWEEQLPLEMARSQRSGTPLSLLVVDLDGFKEVNDRDGHLAGDRLLKEVAASWRGVLRPTDQIARFGGDEFVVLLPACNSAAAVELADRLRGAMPHGLTCSVGVVEWAGDDADEVLARGDAALYEAKAEGRDRTTAR